MTSNAEKPVQLRSHIPTYQRKYFHEPGSVVDKENIAYPENKAAPPCVSRKLFISPTSSAKPRKHSDNSYDHQALRSKGLQEVNKSNNSQGVLQKKRNLSSGDTSGVKPLSRTRFPIYGDDSSKRKDDSTAKFSYHCRATEPRPSVRFEQPKSSCLRENFKNNAVAPIQRNRDSDGKSSSRGSSCSSRVSPADLQPHISRSNVSKIKETHKQTSILKKTPKAVYDVLSLELAYNIDYMSEYVRFQMEINEKKTLSSKFLTRGVTPDQRRLIVKYLISSTTYYKYPSFILYQAVRIFDSYIDTVEVSVNELQIVALAALWIALKKDLITGDIPEASAIMELGGSIFQGNKKPLIECEKKILMSLNFEISFADPFSMLALYTVMIEEVRTLDACKVQELYYCGCYLMDLSLLVDKMLTIPAVHLAAISAEITLVLNMTSEENMGDPQWSYWRSQVFKANPIIEKYRLPEAQMNDIRNQLLQKSILSKEATTDYYVVYKKYGTKRYGPVSKFMLSKISSLFVERIRNPQYAFLPIVF